MAAEYSEGYREQAQQRLLHIESTMTPQAIAVARGLSEHFAKSWTPGLGHTEALLASASEQERQMTKRNETAKPGTLAYAQAIHDDMTDPRPKPGETAEQARARRDYYRGYDDDGLPSD